MTTPKPQDVPEAPAVISDTHRQNRNYVIEIPEGRRVKRVVATTKGWVKLTPLEAVFDKGQLAGGRPENDAMVRLLAGKRYAELYCTSQASGRDSTDFDRINKSGNGTSLPQKQIDAIRTLICVDSHMGERDRKIVRLVCGLEHWPSAAIREVCGDYKDTISARFREALDSLIEAFETARRKPGSFGE